MKKFVIVSAIIFAFFSCTKNDRILELLQEIKSQNDALKTQVSNLQRTTDSLSTALKITNLSILNLDKKIDSIRGQLRLVLLEIDSLNAQLGKTNANILDIQAKLIELQKKCDDLFKILNDHIASLNSVNDGLIAYFPFSGNSHDSSGNGNHGSINGPILSQDRFGNANRAYLFKENLTDNISGKITFNSQSFTIAVWIKVLAPWTYSTLNLFQIGSSNIDNRSGGFALYIDQNDIYGPGKYSIIGHAFSPILETVRVDSKEFSFLNTWRHITLVRDAKCSKFDLYIDGSLVASKTINEGLTYQNSPQSFSIGNYANINNNPIGARILDEVRLYNRALSSEEIVKIMKK